MALSRTATVAARPSVVARFTRFCRAAWAREWVFYHERVLGTSLELRLLAETEQDARQAEAAVLAEIDRLEAIFSSYDPNSELRRWQGTLGIACPLSAELAEVLTEAERWRAATGGAFHPGSEALTCLWNNAAVDGWEPDAGALQTLAAHLAGPLWTVDAAAGTATRSVNCPVTLNAIAKGYIVDRACLKAAETDGIRQVLVNIGGDLRAWGPQSVAVGITDPLHDAENAPPVARVWVRDGGVASSGGCRRGFRIGDRRHSHLFDPRTGRPISGVAGAAVLARTAAEADVLATAFSVMAPEESLCLADSLPEVACLVVLEEGDIRRSRRWAEVERS